jgi:hypothetical protein
MPIVEYMLLALLGSASAATPGGTPAGPLTRTLTADAVTQPCGGTEGLLGQATGGSSGKRSGSGGHVGGGSGAGKVRTAAARRHHRRGHRRTMNQSSSTTGTGGVKPNMNAQPRPPRPRRASNANKKSK